MHFYCYSAINELTISTSLGEPDYSYYFLLKAYRPLLEALGTVEIISTLDDRVAAQYEQLRSQGVPCYVFVFAPPHKIPRDLSYNVIPVFAWEYTTLPSQDVLGKEEACWVSALAHFGKAMCQSVFAKEVAQHDVGPLLSIESIPAPVWDTCAAGRQNMLNRKAVKRQRLSFSATVIDSLDLQISARTLYPRTGVLRPFDIAPPATLHDKALEIALGEKRADVVSVGFYPAEGWGAWSRVNNAWVLLPATLLGRIRLCVSIKGFGENLGKRIKLHVGDSELPILLSADLVEHEFEIEVTEPVNFLRFCDLDHSRQASDDDKRKVGIGLGTIRMEQIGGDDCALERADIASASTRELVLSGITYTSIFNPRDGRKNWEDLLTAFCYAFRHEAQATLIFKMTCKSATEYLDQLFNLLCKLHPFQCRVVVLHGYLDADQFDALVENSSYVVNASRGEGQCLPLGEFMSSGIPAIAPANTAMADYVTPECAFVVESTPEPTFWPHESHQLLTTYWHRPSWESLYHAYTESFHVGMEQQEKYSAMSKVASERLRQYCSIEVLTERLRVFLQSEERR